jgi:hypothetical protein
MRWFKLPLEMHLTTSNIPSTLDQYPLRMDLDFTPQMGLALDFQAGVLLDFLQERLSQHRNLRWNPV